MHPQRRPVHQRSGQVEKCIGMLSQRRPVRDHPKIPLKKCPMCGRVDAALLGIVSVVLVAVSVVLVIELVEDFVIMSATLVVVTV